MQFGVIGPHPVVWWAGQLAVTIATAVLLVALLRRVVPLVVATATTAVWVVAANHSSLDHWGSGSLAGVSLLLLVAGSVLLARAVERDASPWIGITLNRPGSTGGWVVASVGSGGCRCEGSCGGAVQGARSSSKVIGSSQQGQSPPVPARRMNLPHSHRCSPSVLVPQSSHS